MKNSKNIGFAIYFTLVCLQLYTNRPTAKSQKKSDMTAKIIGDASWHRRLYYVETSGLYSPYTPHLIGHLTLRTALYDEDSPKICPVSVCAE